MELVVITRICKIISCRLMILYTEYCPMSVFICVTLLVSFRCRWFHLQTSKIVLFETKTIANVSFYQAMVLNAQFLPMNLLFFVSVRCWVHHLVTGGYTLFQVFPDCSSSFRVVPPSSRWFQLVPGSFDSFQFIPRFSLYET